jgi:hypothetical protein
MSWELLVLIFIGVYVLALRRILHENLRQTAMIRELLIRNDARSGQIRAELTAIRELLSPEVNVFEDAKRSNRIHEDYGVEPPDNMHLYARLKEDFPPRRWWE